MVMQECQQTLVLVPAQLDTIAQQDQYLQAIQHGVQLVKVHMYVVGLLITVFQVEEVHKLFQADTMVLQLQHQLCKLVTLLVLLLEVIIAVAVSWRFVHQVNTPMLIKVLHIITYAGTVQLDTIALTQEAPLIMSIHAQVVLMPSTIAHKVVMLHKLHLLDIIQHHIGTQQAIELVWLHVI